MKRYTTVGIKKFTKQKLSEVKDELGKETFNETVLELIEFWKKNEKVM